MGRARLPGEWILLLALLALGFARWHDETWDPEPHREESIYLRAFEASSAGASPYDGTGKYKYPPAFAVAGGRMLAALGSHTTLSVLRVGNLAGLVLLAWVGTRGLPWRPWVRFIAAGTLLLSPLAANGLFYGNVTFLLGGPALVALRFHRVRPVLAGFLLGLSIALKPMLVPALALLVASASPSRRPEPARKAAVSALTTAALVSLSAQPSLLPEMLRGVTACPTCATNVSLDRVAYCFGMALPPVAWLALACLAALVLGRRMRLDPPTITSVGAALSVLGLPLVWPGTLALTFPLQLAALEIARRRAAPPWKAPSVALAPGAVLSLHGAGGVAALHGYPPVLQGLLTAIPLAALVGLVWLVATFAGRSASEVG